MELLLIWLSCLLSVPSLLSSAALEDSKLNSTVAATIESEGLKESGNPWWVYLIVAVGCTALLLTGVILLVRCIRNRRGRYVVKSGEPRVTICEENVGSIRGQAFSVQTLKVQPLNNHSSKETMTSRKFSSDEQRGSEANLTVERNESSSSSDNEAGDRFLGKHGIVNPVVELEAPVDSKNHKDNRKRRMTYESQTSNDQHVWYFDDDERYSVMQSNTEDREDLDVVLEQSVDHSYNNPLYSSYFNRTRQRGIESPESARHTGDGSSDICSATEEEGRDNVPLDAKRYQTDDGRVSMPPADGHSQPSSPRGEDTHQLVGRGHGIWQYAREVTPDGKRYTKIKATKLRLPSSQSTLASDL